MKKSKNKDVYLKMWGDWIIPDGDFKIGKTVAEGNGEGSNVSYSFIIEGDQKMVWQIFLACKTRNYLV